MDDGRRGVTRLDGDAQHRFEALKGGLYGHLMPAPPASISAARIPSR
jgi:hypothetical protein